MTALNATAGLTALVSTRIYFVKAPQDVTNPYVVVSKISGVREHAHEGASGLAHPRFQCSVFATTYKEAKSIAVQIQTALQGHSGTIGGAGGVEVNGIFYDDEVDFWEEEHGLYHIAMDFRIWHNENGG
jgi:hypothetical protein